MKTPYKNAGIDGAGSAPTAIHRVVGFISAGSPDLDPTSISDQKAAIDAAAIVAAVDVEAYLVELSPRRADETWTPAVRDLLRRARSGKLEAVVVVDVTRFGGDRDGAMLVAITLAELGVRIVEAASVRYRLAASPIDAAGSGDPVRRLGRVREGVSS